MISVIIDKELLNIKRKESRGLITGLKKMHEYGLEITFEDFSKGNFIYLYDLMVLENIPISKQMSYDRLMRISLKKQAGFKGEQVIINTKGKIKYFSEAVGCVLQNLRSASVIRVTKETKIKIDVSLDGNGKNSINTGIGFFDHMLEQIARHGNVNLKINVKGDLDIDEHHTVEDTGIALGQALLKALGGKKGIKRYGYFLPMDDSIARCALDLGGRTYLNFKCVFKRDYVGEFPTELVEEFFRGLASGLQANIYVEADGKNDHHKIENIFKAFAKSLNEACRIDSRSQGSLPSTKGLL